jgi:mannose/fructose/N-acetylgalactosamine-specific phosphotransferase system component IIB
VKAEPGIALFRVDNRLVHGQVLEAWLPALAAQGILVADDEAAANVLARSAMSLAVPARVAFQVVRTDVAADLLKPGGKGAPAPRTLLLVRDVRDALLLHDRGVRIPRLNLGNVHFSSGRKPLTPSVYLGADELDELDRLAATGTEIEARAVPAETPVGLPQLRGRYLAAS